MKKKIIGIVICSLLAIGCLVLMILNFSHKLGVKAYAAEYAPRAYTQPTLNDLLVENILDNGKFSDIVRRFEFPYGNMAMGSNPGNVTNIFGGGISFVLNMEDYMYIYANWQDDNENEISKQYVFGTETIGGKRLYELEVGDIWRPQDNDSIQYPKINVFPYESNNSLEGSIFMQVIGTSYSTPLDYYGYIAKVEINFIVYDGVSPELTFYFGDVRDIQSEAQDYQSITFRLFRYVTRGNSSSTEGLYGSNPSVFFKYLGDGNGGMFGIYSFEDGVGNTIELPVVYSKEPKYRYILENALTAMQIGYSNGYSQASIDKDNYYAPLLDERQEIGYALGYNAGYNKGYADASGGSPIVGSAKNLFTSVMEILDIPIFGENFTLMTLLEIAVVIGLVLFILKMVRS